MNPGTSRVVQGVQPISHHTILRKSPAKFPTFFFTLAILGICSRGLFQIFVGKNIAYAVQALLIISFIVVLLLRSQAKAAPHQLRNLLILIQFAVTAFISASITEGPSSREILIYISVMCFLAFLLFFFNSLTFTFQPTNAPGKILVAFAFISVTVAFLQQYQSLELFPGNDLGTFGTITRPAALTGSFLHYPLVTALFTFIFIGLHGQTHKKIYLVAALVSVIGTLSSYSRSGMVLTLVGFTFGLLLTHGISRRFRVIATSGASALALLVLFPIQGLGERFLSIFDSGGAGNAGRMDAWITAFERWLNSPILVGSYTSRHSNITANLAHLAETGSVESSVFQLLLSFGLLGLLSYYGLIFATLQASSTSSVWFRAGILGAIAQSLFYQSIEVLPFVSLLALVPFISKITQGNSNHAPQNQK